MIYVYRYAVIVLYTLFWGVIACALALVDHSGEGVIWVGRRWVSWILALCHVQVDAEGLDNFDPKSPYVVMSNHQSVFDIAAILKTLPMSFRFVAKRELTRIPLFGWALALGGHIIIDRSRRERAVHSLAEAAKRIRNGVTVIIFPEGTRSPTGELREFKSGGFHLALQAGVPVLPVSVSGSRHIAPKRSLRIESGRILIRYGRPIPTEGLGVDDRGQLKEAVRRAILAGMEPALQGEPIAPTERLTPRPARVP